MNDPAGLAEAWRAWGRLRPVHRRPILAEPGLLLGAGTVLTPQRPDYFGRPRLDLDAGEARLLALLAVAHGRRFDGWVVEALRPAAAAWRLGDAGAARLCLAYARLPPLPGGEAAPRRLFIAAGLLDSGWPADDLPGLAALAGQGTRI